MEKRITALFVTLAVCALLIPSADAEEPLSAKAAQDNGHAYYIMVNRKMSVVTVYALDENGFYTVPVRAMVCSAGAAQTRTPRVTSAIGRKHRWRLMLGGVYAQYVSQFYNDCLFHSVCYEKPNSAALLRGYYNALGAPASHGCVRLQTEDAKWIYENCDEGTSVTIYDSDDPGELGKPAKMVDRLTDSGWDPTDPAPDNPWAGQWTADIRLSASALTLAPGETASLDAARTPEDTRYPTVMYRSDDPRVAIVDGAGRIRAVGVGAARIAVTCGDTEKHCTVRVFEPEFPFCDVPGNAWFASDVRFLFDKGLISRSEDYTFAPEAAALRAEAFQLLYNLAGRPAPSGDAGRIWYADAADWAADAGIAALGDPAAPLSRQELLELLHRCDLALFDDLLIPEAGTPAIRTLDSAAQEAEHTAADAAPGSAAVAWALRIGLLPGDSIDVLSLGERVTRAQMAALAHRYCLAREIS